MLTDGQKFNEGLSYAQLPKEVVARETEGNFADSVASKMSAAATTIAHEVPPQAGPRAFLHRLRHGDEIAHLITLTFAAVILLLTSMLVYELWVNSHLSRATFGWNFFWTKIWDPIFDNFGAAALHLRHAGNLGRCARARCAAWPRQPLSFSPSSRPEKSRTSFRS